MSNSRQEELQAELSRRKELEAELASRKQQSLEQESPQQTSNNGIFDLGDRLGMGMPESARNRGIVDVIRDLVGGVAKGSQNLASAGLEAGEYLTRHGANALGRELGHPVDVPYWNAREYMGLEGDRPINLGKMIASKNPDPMTMAVGQFGLPAASGGLSALRQMLTQGAYGAAQAKPDEQNAFGALPSGRGGAFVENALLAGAPFAFPKLVGMAKNAIKKYLSPQKTYNELINTVSGGKTIPENIKELSERTKYGQKIAKEEALIPKREVMSESGEERIFPSQKKGEKITNDTSSIFAEHPKDITPDKMQKYQKVLKSYYKDGDIDTLIEKGEEIFQHPGLKEKDISKLDEMLIPEKPVKGEYLKTKNPDEHYSEIIQEAHDAYVKNPTFKNSDKLRSRLFKRINELNVRQKAKTITDAQEVELRSLNKSRNAIIRDQDNLIETFSPENKGKYGKFNEKWRNDVRAYEDANTTIKNLKNGNLKNMTPQKITNAFSFPELNPQMQRILKDIGPEGINNIVYNAIGKTKTAKESLKLLENLEKNKGFAQYMTPEIRSYANKMKMQLRNKNAVKWSAGALGAGALYEMGKNALSK